MSVMVALIAVLELRARKLRAPIVSGLAPDPGVVIESWCQLWFIQRSFELSIYALAIAGRSLLPARC
jgi:hypothetical protein